MSQQTRIDQFYKTGNSKRRCNGINEKRNAKYNNVPSIRNKKQIGKKMSPMLSVQTKKSVYHSYYTISYKKSDETVFFEDGNDNELSQIVDEIESKELLSQEAECLKCTPPNIANDKNESSSIVNNWTKTPKKELDSMDENGTSNAVSNIVDSPSSRSHYSPKTASQKSPSRFSPKKLFDRRLDTDLITQAMEQLNLAKQGAIPPNNFDLNEVYSQQIFDYEYSQINSKTSLNYEIHNVMLSEDIHARILLTTIFTVFSKPINCGYFSEDELDFIYSIITLPVQAQMLLVRMLKRKRTWYRKSSVNYPEIASDLEDIFKILDSRSICVFGINSNELTTMLELLQVQELRKICQTLKQDSKGKKEENIKRLLKFSNTKSLFPGVKSPHAILSSLISNTLGFCIRLTEKTWNIIDRILTLLIPNQDPENTIAKTFFILFDIYQEKLMYPKMPAYQFPIFSSKDHLISYVEARNLLRETLNSIERKDWVAVQQCGSRALERIPAILRPESKSLKNSKLPSHVKHFMPGYVWLKILSKTVDAFKKSTSTRPQAIEALNVLINQDCHMENRKGKWYAELALIEMFHHKDAEASAHITIQALRTESLTHVDKIDLIGRAERIIKKKSGVTANTKATIREVIDSQLNRIMPLSDTPSIIIDAALVRGCNGLNHFTIRLIQTPAILPHINKQYTYLLKHLINTVLIFIHRSIGPKVDRDPNSSGSKSMWRIDSGTDDQTYGSVEAIASHHYCNTEYSQGLHCEGALPVTLLFTLFWEEIFDIPVPGAYVTAYQSAPQDLYTKEFYENRKERIDMKIQIVYNLDSESLSHVIHNKFTVCSQYESLIQSNLFNSSQLKEIVHCLGVEGVLGICKRLIHNFNLWRAGFPDLVVWNSCTKKCKIVEVKGPRDTLSTKQRLWLDYLSQLGLDTEVCLVQDRYDAKRPRHQVEND